MNIIIICMQYYINNRYSTAVCDILPHILQVAAGQLNAADVMLWLKKSIHFYVCFMADSLGASRSDGGQELSFLLHCLWMSMCEVGLYHCVTFTDVLSVDTLLAGRVVIAGLSDKDSIINTPRQDAIHLIKLASRHLDWNTCDLFDLKT